MICFFSFSFFFPFIDFPFVCQYFILFFIFSKNYWFHFIFFGFWKFLSHFLRWIFDWLATCIVTSYVSSSFSLAGRYLVCTIDRVFPRANFKPNFTLVFSYIFIFFKFFSVSLFGSFYRPLLFFVSCCYCPSTHSFPFNR